MKYLRSITLVVALAVVLATTARTAKISTMTPEGRSVTVTALADNILKVDNNAPGLSPNVSRASVIATPESGATVSQVGDIAVLTTPTGVVATVNMTTGQLVINGGNAGKVITDDGVRRLSDGKQILTLATTAKGSYYGAGERGHKLNLRGDTLTMYNRQNYGYTKGDPRINQMNITMPLFLSTDGFALVFDDYAASKMILGEGKDIEYITESPRPVSYYYVNGASTLADVTTNLTSLTGRQPLPPLWSLGYITSKYGYHDERETVGCIDSLVQRGYPVDGIVLDLYWYGKEQDMGRLEWEPSQWPDPEKMLADLKKRNVNLVAISQPYILRNGRALDNYNELASKGMLVADSTGLNPQEVVIWVGEGGMFDVSNPATRGWLADRYRKLTDMGVTGWWGDLGEPEVHPETGLHSNGLTARLYHNQYGNDWSEIISDLFAKEYPDTRLLTMMRGGTTGLQRYSVFPWSTDVSRSWGGLQPQVTIMLNSGLSGLGYMGHDVGGFAVDSDNPEDDELYMRWLQLGLFSPMLRTHAQYNAEPYHYPRFAKETLRLIKERYRWLPYNYTLAYENARYGYPLVRPLNFTEPATNAYDAIDDEYLWGSEVLVAPVMQQGAVARSVTFPKGEWVDAVYPYAVFEGGSTIDYDAPIDKLPLFVKAGAVIPMATGDMKSTADYNPADITLCFYPVKGAENTFTMYDDDRTSPRALADGAYRLLHFSSKTDADGSRLSITTDGTYPGAPATIHFTVKVLGLSVAPKALTIDGKRTSFRYHRNKMEMTFKVSYTPGSEMIIELK